MHWVIYDFETAYDRKDYTLSKMSAIDYVRDPRFHALMVGISIDFAPAVVYEHDDIPAALAALELHKPDRILIGHNSSGFDNLILSEVYGIRPAIATDTMHLMRWTGVSRLIRENLASMTHWFGTGEKRAGTVISDGKYRKEDFTPAEWEDFKRYCVEDVTQTAACAKAMLPYMTPAAIQFSSITSRMATEPVFWINPLPLHQFINDLDAKAEATRMELQKLFHFATQEEFIKAIRSADKFCAMLRAVGAEPPMKVSEAKSETKRKRMEEQGLDTSDRESWTVYTPALSKQDIDFMDMLDDPDERVRQLVQARMEHNTSVPRTRAMNLLHAGEYMKPVPVMLKCFYAHTSRYGAGTTEGKSDGIQWQNLSKRNKAHRPLRQGIVVPEGMTVVACDSSQIEARTLAYIACENELLSHFREKRDPYAEQASKFGFGLTAQQIHDGAKNGEAQCKLLRNIGKTFVLGGGYGVGAIKTANTLLRAGIRLSDDRKEHNEKARQLHQIYRASNPSIVNFWRTCQKVIEGMAAGSEGYFGGPHNDLFHYGMMPVCGREMVPSIQLPTGYILRYPNLHMEVGEKKAEFFYDKPLGKNVAKVRIYGPALTENINQCLAFQILLVQANLMDNAGIHLACNIHDSFATVVPDAEVERTVAVMLQCMRTVPEWVAGLPLDAEAETADDFTIV